MDKKLNWIEYNLYLLPFRRIVCFIVEHNWVYDEGDIKSESFIRECQRCGRAEASFIIKKMWKGKSIIHNQQATIDKE